MTNIKNNVQKIKQTLINHPKTSIVAVSKKQPLEKIIDLLENTDIISLGENYVQEAKEKFTNLKQNYPNVKLHLIGHLQSNKIKDALEIFDVIQTLDSIKLLNKLVEHDITTKEFFIQVNLDKENKNSGVLIEDLEELINESRKQKINLIGLMAILPIVDNPEPYFAFMKHLKNKYNVQYLSMGMSNDYLKALQFDTNYVRIGTKIFGERN